MAFIRPLFFCLIYPSSSFDLAELNIKEMLTQKAAAYQSEVMKAVLTTGLQAPIQNVLGPFHQNTTFVLADTQYCPFY